MTTETPSWEIQKENAAPLQRGRNVAALAKSCGMETEQDRQAKEAMVRHYESLVHRSEEMAIKNHILGEEDEDVLIHWMAYIKYHQDYFPSDTQSQFLLMERCARALLHQPKYFNDLRFIRVCVMYADKNSNPGEIFRFFHQQKVGAKTSLFWVAWAFWAEKSQDYKLAERIFKKARSKGAQPAKLLEQRHRQFERRMVRLTIGQVEGEDDIDDEEDEGTSRRGVLGGLSEEAFRRNDRSSARSQGQAQNHQRAFLSSTSMPTFTDRSSSRRREHPPGNSNTNKATNSADGAGFQIFIEDGQENCEYAFGRNLPSLTGKRQLPREEDRRKENTLAAEKWNQRGGLHVTSIAAPAASSSLFGSSTALQQAPPPVKPQPFAVFVDEECAQKHQKEDLQRQADEDRHRRHRDERTFRNLGVGDSLAEKLHQDPLRYMKDPAKMEGDTVHKSHSAECDPKQRDTKLARKGDKKNKETLAFDAALLKDGKGIEQCFEEFRAFHGKFKLASENTNLNLLQRTSSLNGSRRSTNDSAMDITTDTASNNDVSVHDATMTTFEKEMSRRVLFRNNTSFEANNNRSMINVSQCSSAVNEALAVGVDEPEEETINTKWAMKEMSMMFYSPAVGLDTTAQQAQRNQTNISSEIIPGYNQQKQQQTSFDSRYHQQQESDPSKERKDDHNELGDDTTGFDVMIDLVETLNNSVLQPAESNDNAENQGPRNPNSRINASQSIIDKHALQPLHKESSALLSCAASEQRPLEPLAQDNPLARSAINKIREDPGFVVYEDGADASSGQASNQRAFSVYEEKPAANEKVTFNGFRIFDETSAKGSKKAKSTSGGFQIFDETAPETSKRAKPETPSGRIQIHSERVFDQSQGVKATSSPRAFESFGALDKTEAKTVPFSLRVDESNDLSSSHDLDGGDTASLTAIGELFSDTLKGAEKEDDDSAFDGRPSEVRSSFSGSIITDQRSFGDISVIDGPNRDGMIASPTMTMNFGIMNAVDYNKNLRSNTKGALNSVLQDSTGSIEQLTSLTEILSAKNIIYDVSKYVLPRVFKKKLLDQGSEIRIGTTSGTVVQELGRGAFGVVVLMNRGNRSAETMAVKAQVAAETLAWEYDLLKKLESRIPKQQTNQTFPFPKALAFASLADGGLMSMTAASESGLNLVDVRNIYQIRLGSSVPELVALHFTSRMLHHLEILHWHGKILHCDVKPDNWVVTVDAADLVLVDFGRAVDLSALANGAMDAMDVKLIGAACEKDMMCVAMRKERPWSFDADSFGLLASLHVLLFGTHIEIEQYGKRWMPKQHLRRYWNRNLLTEIFDTLLNTDEGTLIGSRPRSLRALRKKVDSYLAEQQTKLDSELGCLRRMLPSNRSQIHPVGGKK